MNERGIPIDTKYCRGAVKILAEAYRRNQAALEEQTKGEITSGGQVQRILKFVNERGVNIDTLDADTVSATLKSSKLNPEVRTVLELRQMAAGAAVKKYRAALDLVSADGRLRESLLFYAASTGRWSGRGLQPQNMKRGVKLDPTLVGVITEGDFREFRSMIRFLGETTIDTLGKYVRGIIRAPAGKRLLMSDYSQIEARVAHWLAGDKPMLSRFRRGDDPYIPMASKIFNVAEEKVTKDQRHLGKIAVLGLGYGMGTPRFAEQANVNMTLAGTAVDIYREVNAGICKLWRQLEQGAKRAIQGNMGVTCGRIIFAMEGKWLTMRLPSGRKLYYFNPKVGPGRKSQEAISYRRRGGRLEIWGGTFLENACQAISRDLLCHAMLRMQEAQLEIIFTVHDEVVLEVDQKTALDDQATVEGIMVSNPHWADQLPLAVESELKERFEK